MRKKPVKPRKDGLAVLVESTAALQNLAVEEITNETGKRIWKLSAGTAVSTEVVVWGEADTMTCHATPILARDGYEVFLPSDVKLSADSETVSVWLPQAVVKTIERADALLEILTCVSDIIKASGYQGRVKSMPPGQNNEEIFFPYLIAEQVNDKVFATEIIVSVNETEFVCKMTTRIMGRNGGLPIAEVTVGSASDPDSILEYASTALDMARAAYESAADQPPMTEAYARLLQDPRAYDGKVLLMIPRAKNGDKTTPDK